MEQPQWDESVLSTRSLSYVSNAGSVLSPGLHSRKTSLFQCPSLRRQSSLAGYSEDSDGPDDQEMVDEERMHLASLATDGVAELPHTVTNSHFFELPREIRDRIYALCLTARDNTPVEWPRPTEYNNPYLPSAWRTYQLQPQLLRTCKIIYDEAAPLLYMLNNMTFYHPSDANMFVRAMASVEHARQITHLNLHVKAQDLRLWIPYLTSTDSYRSLTADFPNLRELGIRFRSSKWQPQQSPEWNLRVWHDDTKLEELINSLHNIYQPPPPPIRGHAAAALAGISEAEYQAYLAQSGINRTAFLPRDVREWRDRLAAFYSQQDLPRPSTKQLHLLAHASRDDGRPSIRICCACRVPPPHFAALTLPVSRSSAAADINAAPPLGSTADAISHPPVREGDAFRGFSPADLQHGIRKLYEPELGSANVARTPFANKIGIMLALEIYCLETKA